MKPEGSLPHSQQPATCPYPKPDQSSPYTIPLLGRSILILVYVYTQWELYYNKTQHTKNTAHKKNTQHSKHSTQNYKNNNTQKTRKFKTKKPKVDKSILVKIRHTAQ
jgi:hypothetical protein